MPVDSEKKIIFIHNPKCAGTSIAKALGIYGISGSHNLDITHLYGFDKDNNVLQSLCLKFYENYLPDTFIKECFIFGVVRNPYDRLLSDFCWNNRGCKTLYDYLILIKNILEELNDLELMKYNRIHFNHFLPQYKYFESDKYKVNAILRFENLQQDFNEFVNNNIQLDITNTSNHESWSQYYNNNPKCVELVNQIYEKDFELYNYKMIKL